MARITTDRPEAAQYNGKSGKFVREVLDGPSFHPDIHQVIVSIDGVELQFFASEVTLSKDEEDGVAKAREKHEREAGEAREAAQRNMENKRKAFDYTRPGGLERERKDREAAERESGEAGPKPGENPSAGPVPGTGADAPDHGGRDQKRNRLPSDPPDQAQGQGLPPNPNPNVGDGTMGGTGREPQPRERPIPSAGQPQTGPTPLDQPTEQPKMGGSGVGSGKK